MAWGKTTYQAPNEMRESLLDIIRDISPNEDNYFVSNLDKGAPALQTYHEWNIFHEDRVSSVTANTEGADTSYPDLQAESRAGNYTVIVDSPVKLSRTKASIAMVTKQDALAVEKERALRRLKNKMEFLLINGSLAAGATNSARGMAGIDAFITSNVTAYASGQSFTEAILNDMAKTSWDAVGSSYVASTLVAPAVIKQRVATFGTNLTRNVRAEDKRLINEVRVFDTDLGVTVKILAHKDVRKAAGTVTVLLVNEDLHEMSFLVNTGEPHWEDRAKAGDYVAGVYITEFTHVAYNEKADVKRTGFSASL